MNSKAVSTVPGARQTDRSGHPSGVPAASPRIVGHPEAHRWGTWGARYGRFAQIWQRVGLFMLLGLLLLLVVLTCVKASSPLIPILLVVGLIIAAYAIWRPSVALLLIFAGAGLPSVIVPLSFHTMRLVEPTVGLCLLIIVLYRPSMRLRLPHLLALLFLGIGILSFIHIPTVSTNPDAYASDKELFLVALFILALFVGTFLIEYIKNISAFLVAILLSNIPLYLVGLLQALGIHIFSFLEDSGARDPLQTSGRLWGPFIGAATFGFYLTSLLAVALCCWLLGTRRRDRIIGAVMTAATMLEIVGSGTRSAALAAAVMVLLALFVTRHFRLMLGTIALAGLYATVFFSQLLAKFAHPDTGTDSRLFVWQLALQLIHANPWLGIGLEQFPVYYARVIVPRATQLNPNGISVHNQYLEWALASGIIWSLIAVTLLISIMYFCIKAYRRAQRGQQALLLSAILAISAVLITSFVDVPLEKTEGAVFLFLLSGLALGLVERIRREKTQVPMAQAGAAVANVQVVSPTGLDSTLYRPIPVPRRSSTPVPSSTTGELDVREEAPNVQKTGRSVILQLLTWGISATIIFPATAFLTRYLGPVQYGEYSFTIPFLTIFAVFTGTGMDPLITRTLSTQPRSKWSATLSFAAGARLLSTLAISAGAALTAFLLPVSAEQRILLLLGSGCLLFSYSFNGLRTVYECGFWAEQRMSIPSAIEATDRVVTSGLIAVAIVLHLSLPWTYILIMYSDLPFALTLALLARRRFRMQIRFSLTHIRTYIVGSLPLTVHNALGAFANQASLLLLLPLAGSLSVGLYSLGLRIISPLQSIAIVYVIGVYPLLCKEFAEKRAQFSALYCETTRLMALVIIPIAIFANLQARNIAILLGGERFAAASTVIQVLMWAVVIAFFTQLAIRSCMAANQERFIPYVTGTVLAVNVVGSLVLIPRWQATGGALAALLSQLVALVLFSILLARHVNLLRTALVVLRVALGNVPAVVALLLLPHVHPFLLVPLYILLAAGGCIATRTLSLKDVSGARHILLSRGGKEPRETVKKNSRDLVKNDMENDVASDPAIDISEQPTLVLPTFNV